MNIYDDTLPEDLEIEAVRAQGEPTEELCPQCGEHLMRWPKMSAHDEIEWIYYCETKNCGYTD